jgi:hypothetical protein
MEDSVFSPKQWQTAGLSSSLNPNSIDQVEDREMAGSNKRQIKITGSFYRQLGFLDSSVF